MDGVKQEMLSAKKVAREFFPGKIEIENKEKKTKILFMAPIGSQEVLVAAGHILWK